MLEIILATVLYIQPIKKVPYTYQKIECVEPKKSWKGFIPISKGEYIK